LPFQIMYRTLNLKPCFFIFIVFVSVCFCQWQEADKTVSPSGSEEQTVTYMVKSGDNLWDISFKFLGDPFRWPEVWRRNPYIKNPNLIYPGNTLVISGPGQVGGAQPTERIVSEAAGLQGGAQDAGAADRLHKQPTSGKSDSAANRSVDSLLFSGLQTRAYLTEETIERSAFLWFDKDTKGRIYPGNGCVGNNKNGGTMTAYAGEVYRQFDEMPLISYGSNPYKAGDTVDIFHSDKFVRFMGKTANIVRRTGRARISAVRGLECTAVLFMAWDFVTAGDRVDTATHFRSMEIDTLVERDAVIKGTIFRRIEQTERPYLFHSFLCDRGSKDGVRFGDIFAVYARLAADGSMPLEAIACVVNVGALSSTLRIEKLYGNTLEAGDTLELIKRVRFK